MSANHTPMLRALAASIRAGVPALLWGNPGTGKALAVRTPIATPNGWTTMGDLQVGDRVFDEAGWPCEVTAVFDQPPGRQCFEVVFDDGSSVVADEDHLWETHSRAYRQWLSKDTRLLRHRNGSDDAIRLLRDELNDTASHDLTTISAELQVFEASGVAHSLIRRAASSCECVARVRFGGHVWASAEVAATGLPVPPNSGGYVTFSQLIEARVPKQRATRLLRRARPIHPTPGSIYRRRQLLGTLGELLRSYPYDQRAVAAKPEVLTTRQIAESLTVEGGLRSNHAIPIARPLDLPEVELPVAPYTFGAWLGDGHSSSSGITTMDEDVLAAISADGYETRLRPGSVSPTNRAASYGISSRLPGSEHNMTARLRALGVINNKHIPTIYLRASIEQRSALLAGLLDTDGYCSENGYIDYASTSERLARDVHELAVSLGYKAVLRSRPAPKGRPGRQISWQVFFTTERPVFRLRRKLHRQTMRERATQSYRYVVAVRPVDSTPVRCITVDSPSHLYLAGLHMVPTHNTSVITALAHGWQWHTEVVIGSIRESSDFLGFGVEVDGGPGKVGHVAYAPPGWARAASKADRALVFFDELTTAPPSVRKAMLRVLQERVVGDLHLPDTVAIVAAANPPESAVDGYDLEPPMANRLMHLDFTFPLDAWLDGFVSGFDNISQPSMTDLIGRGDDQHRASIRAAVVAFLRSRPDLIEPGVPDDPTKAGRAWPSRRSWDNAARVLCELRPGDDEATILVLKGTVGDGPANEFLAFHRELDLPDPLDVIAHPTRYDWSGMRPDKAFATVNAIRAYVLGTTPDKTLWLGAVNALSTIAEAGLPDIAQGAVAALLSNMPDGVGVPRRVRDAFAELFVGIGRWAA